MKDNTKGKNKKEQENIVVWAIKSVAGWLFGQPRITRISMLIFLAAAVYFGIFEWQARQREDSSGPEINMEEDFIKVSVKDDESILLQGVTAYDRKDGDVTDTIVVENLSSFVADGRRTVTYAAFDSDNHVEKASRSVLYTDYKEPTFSLGSPLQFTTNAKSIMGDLTVMDCIDGDITSTVKFLPQGEFSVETPGTYQVEFRAVNSAGDVAILNAPIEIYEQGTNRGPQIILSDYLVYINKGEAFDPKKYLKEIKLNRIYDIVEGEGNYDMEPQPKDERLVVGSNHIDIENRVNAEIPGTYIVTYSRTADSGNQDMVTGSVHLIVIVKDSN